MKMKILIPVLLILAGLLHAQTALIWYPGGNASSSATAIEAALGGHVSSVSKATSLSGVTLTPANYEYVFVCLGVYSDNYTLDSSNDSDAIEKLIDYLQAGGKLYMEGGDAWAWDAQTSLQPYFNLYGEADGEGDLSTLSGASCLSSYSFLYGGSQNHIDRIVPLDGSVVLFTNNSPAYACAVGHENSTYNYVAIGASFEFGGLTDGVDTKADLMGDLLTFLDGGCTTTKPAPLNVQAVGGYDGAVTIMWDAPPGQASLSATPNEAPTLTFSTAGSRDVGGTPKAGRQRAESKLADTALFGNTISASGYQIDSYNVFRSTTSGGSYAQIASGVSKQYYRDASTSNGQTYYYIIKGVYSGVEGDASNESSAQAVADGNFHSSPWKFVEPAINGAIETDEWSNASSRLITAPGQSSPVTLYTFHNDNYLYLAIDETGNAVLTTDDQIGISFDEDLNYNWPSSSTSEEGTIWLNYESGSLSTLFRGLKGWWPLDVQWSTPSSTSGITAAASTSSGHVQYEARFDLSSGVLDVSAGDTFSMYIYTLDFPDSTFSGAWPEAVKSSDWQDAWLLPSLFGAVELAAKGSSPFIQDVENVTTTATAYSFNEFGDGHKVEVYFSSLSGQGDVTVVQTKEDISNPATPNYIDCAWTISKESAITDFVADLIFHYNDADVAGLDESKLQVHRWIETTSTWQYEGGVVNAAENTVTLTTNLTGTYALFEREYVLAGVKVLLQGAYDSGAVMTTELYSNSAIPPTSTLDDGRIIGEVPAGVTDWLMLELRSTPDGAAVSQRSFLVKGDGTIVDWDGTTHSVRLPAADGDYYIVVKHRNHLAAMSAAAVSLNSAAATVYDFSTGTDKYYGSDAALLDVSPANIYGLYAGDATGNGQVQNDDKNEDWKSQTGTSGYKSADFNLNAQVQNNDKNDFWKINVGRGTQVP